jgi:hypothetical protein
MGLDVRWVVVLENPHPEGEWKIIEALERRLPGGLQPRLATSRDKRMRTLVVPSFARWDEISSDAEPTHRHPSISDELEEIQTIIGELPLYYSHDNEYSPGDWLTEDETYELVESMQLVDGTFSLVAGLLAGEARALGKGN